MSDVLTPQLALDYLAELQPWLRSAAIIDAQGTALAGEDPGDGLETVAASMDGYTIRAVADDSLAALLRLDVETVLTDLAAPDVRSEAL